MLVIFHAFCKCDDKGAKLLTSALLDLKLLILKKEQYFFCQISDQPPPKRTTFVRFVGTYTYVDKKQTVFVQL